MTNQDAEFFRQAQRSQKTTATKIVALLWAIVIRGLNDQRLRTKTFEYWFV